MSGFCIAEEGKNRYDALHMTDSLKQQVAQNTAIQIGGKIAGTVLSLVSAGMIFRYLGDDHFGGYTTILSLVQIFGTLMDLGLYVLLIKKLASPLEPETTIHALFTLRVISACIFLLCAPITAIALGFFSHLYTTEIIIGVTISTLFAFGVSMNQLFSAVFQKFFVSYWIAAGEIINKVALVVGIALVTTFNFGLIGIVSALSLSTLLSTVVLLVASRKYITMRFHWNTKTMRHLLLEAWPVAVSVALVLLYFRGDVIVLSLFEKSQQPIGIYGAPYKILEVLITFPAMFTGLMLNPITNQWKSGNIDGVKKLVRQATNAIGMLALPIVAGLLAIPTPIMHFIAGRDFTQSGSILSILSIATGGIFFGTLFGYVVVALDKQRDMMLGYAVVAVTALLFYFILIPHFSIYGAAWVTVYSEVSVAVIAFFLIRRVVKFTIDYFTLIKVAAASAVMGVIVSFLSGNIEKTISAFTSSTTLQDGISVALLTLIGACCYGALIVLFRATSIGELKSLVKRG